MTVRFTVTVYAGLNCRTATPRTRQPPFPAQSLIEAPRPKTGSIRHYFAGVLRLHSTPLRKVMTGGFVRFVRSARQEYL